MALRQGEICINDSNWQQHVGPPIVAGQHFAKGLIPRDYKAFPQGCYAAAKAFSMPLIPRSEWSDRIKDMEATKSRLSDIRRTSGPNGGPIPSLDQNGRGYCVTEDTEILTEKGWVAYPQYNWTDLVGTMNPTTGLLEFQQPTHRHVYEYDGKMIYSTNRRIDFGVTPDHRMLVRKWDESQRTLSNGFTFQKAGELGWYVGLPHSTLGFIGTDLVELAIEGDRHYDGDDFLAMLSVIVSDGYASNCEGHTGMVSFCCFREDRYERLAALAARVGFKEVPGRKGVWARYSAHALAAWVRANCYTQEPYHAQNKKVPDIIKAASMRQIKHFMSFYGDQNHTGQESVFYSSSKRIMDDLQELHLRIGKRSTISMRGPRRAVYEATGQVIESKESFTLFVSQTDRLCLDRKKHLETDHYKGQVYCASVPNGTLVTRRNGSVLISGNCWGHSATMATILTRARDNQPYVRLSAYMLCCIIKNYKDEGGWGAQGLDFIMANGVPSVDFWPEKSVNHSNDNPAMRANAALHKVTEGFMDMAAAEYDRNLTLDQTMTCLLMRIPVIGDFNWWSHSICLIDPVEVTPGVYGIRFINSWTDSYGDMGEAVLSGSKMVPDGATAPAVSTASDT